MKNSLNLSGWIKVRKADIGPYTDYIVKSVAKYEDEIKNLRDQLSEKDKS